MQTENHIDPAPRLDLELPVNFRRNYARRNDLGSLKNISLTGAFLVTQTREVHLNEKITVTFEVSGRKRELASTVVWKDQDGFGIQFNPFNNRDVQIVDDLMYFVKDKKSSKKDVLDSIFSQIS